jgi:hypothetical protein
MVYVYSHGNLMSAEANDDSSLQLEMADGDTLEVHQEQIGG